MTDHPIIQLFQSQAELLDIGGDKSSLDDAIVRLAGWMGMTDLPADDFTVLTSIGGILYREGLKRRMSKGGQEG